MNISPECNVARRLDATAAQNPQGIAIAMPTSRRYAAGKRIYDTITFEQLRIDSDQIAAGLLAMGMKPQMRIVLMVPPSIEFITLVFAMLKAGVTMVLIDPGMGRKNLVRCLSESDPEGFVAIPLVHAIRSILRFRFPNAKHLVTVGRRWFWGGKTLGQVKKLGLGTTANGSIPPLPSTKANDPAAIIFTTGSTGPPKGVEYQHGNFDRQVLELQAFYNIQPGEIDLPGFPLFALFNAAMGVSTVIPDMDPTRPANVNPQKLLEAIEDWKVTQAFGSPALWNVVGQYCEKQQIKLPTLRRVLSAGAPVPEHVLRRMKYAIPADGDVHTPYGATESLPVASIAASEVLTTTASLSRQGKGTCVGRHFPGIQWKVIAIHDGPLTDISQVQELPSGQIGEIMVRGPVVTQRYVTRSDANALHKVKDGEGFWHRIGDVGYFDGPAEDPATRFWFCGRKSHRVVTPQETLFTEPCEALFNTHPLVYRSALVGAGEFGRQIPVLFVEPWADKKPLSAAAQTKLVEELRVIAQQSPLTCSIQHFFVQNALPVDIRHNAKIFREKLAVIATNLLKKSR